MKEALIELGLTPHEATVYEILARYTRITGNELAKKTGIDRSVTYNLLSSLAQKGLVNYVYENNKKQFSITDPDTLYKDLDRKRDLATEIIEKVNAFGKIDFSDESVRVYEGTAGTKIFYHMMIAHPNQPLYSFGGDSSILERLKIYIPHYVTLANSLNIQMKFIHSKDRKLYTDIHKQMFVEVRTCDVELLPVSCSVFVDYVIYHHYEQDPLVIVIKNSLISTMMQQFFLTLWDQLE